MIVELHSHMYLPVVSSGLPKRTAKSIHLPVFGADPLFPKFPRMFSIKMMIISKGSQIHNIHANYSPGLYGDRSIESKGNGMDFSDYSESKRSVIPP